MVCADGVALHLCLVIHALALFLAAYAPTHHP
jgi:hypothetical protein